MEKLKESSSCYQPKLPEKIGGDERENPKHHTHTRHAFFCAKIVAEKEKNSMQKRPATAKKSVYELFRVGDFSAKTKGTCCGIYFFQKKP